MLELTRTYPVATVPSQTRRLTIEMVALPAPDDSAIAYDPWENCQIDVAAEAGGAMIDTASARAPNEAPITATGLDTTALSMRTRKPYSV